jgi:hypothetical protein
VTRLQLNGSSRPSSDAIEALASMFSAMAQAASPAPAGDAPVQQQLAFPAPPPQLLFRLRDAAAQLGIGVTKLRDLERAGHISFLRIDGSVVVDWDELVRFRDRLREAGRIDS